MKTVPGFTAYTITENGQVNGRRGPLTVGRTASGYSRVTLYGAEGPKTLRLARLILLAFRGPCPPGHEAAHLNGVRADDRLDNLAWKTVLANHADKKLHGTAARGSCHGMAKLDADKVASIRASTDGDSALARRFGVSRPVVRSVRERRTWGHV